jgi:murein DD-endopeptidase MepM/ murein hydrolase activator NlpD
MPAFTIDVSNPFTEGFTGGLGGPGVGGHVSPHWYIQYGMDLAAAVGTTVHAAFDAHITRFTPHVPADDSGKVYGAQLFMRSPNDCMGGFYTHLTGTQPGLAVGSAVNRGDALGTVYGFAGIAPHLHLALVEILGGAPNGRYQGVDLYQLFLDTANTDTVTSVEFRQDGSPPVAGGRLGYQPFDLGGLRGIQAALAALGFDPGPLDGLDGPKTRAAVTAFQMSRGLDADGVCGHVTLLALRTALVESGFDVG